MKIAVVCVTYNRPRQLGQLGRGDGRADDREEGDGGSSSGQTEEDQRTADDLEGPHEVGRDRGPREPDPLEALDAHGRIGELQDTLGEEDEAYGQPDQDDARRPVGGRPEEKGEHPFHRVPFSRECPPRGPPAAERQNDA